MDYKYIEQLLERYWACETSEAEERILHTFFSQPSVPAELVRYKALFDYEHAATSPRLSDDFDERLLAKIKETADEKREKKEENVKEVFKARRINWGNRFAPLYRAAAIVAIVMLVGNAAQHSFNTDASQPWDYNTAAYRDSYTDPQQAYEAGIEALQLFKEGPQTALADSVDTTNR